MKKKELDGLIQSLAAMMAASYAMVIYHHFLQEIELQADPDWVISSEIRKEWRENLKT